MSGRRTEEIGAVPVFEAAFGVPAGHALRPVASGPGAGAGDVRGPWEHEEYDGAGRLVAVYESRPRRDGGLAFVKYSPHGWVLSLSGRSPRHPPPPPRPRARRVGAA
jgi:hypothetical protein